MNPATCIDGYTLTLNNKVRIEDIKNLCKFLDTSFNSTYPNQTGQLQWQFAPESSSGGGIRFKSWPDKSEEMYKTFRFDFKNWPEENSPKWFGAKNSVISQPFDKMYTYLKTFYGAPAWTFEELQLFEAALNKIGITVGAYPCDSELLTPEEVQRRGGDQNIKKIEPSKLTTSIEVEVKKKVKSNQQNPSIIYQLADNQSFQYVVEYLQRDLQQQSEGDTQTINSLFQYNLADIIVNQQKNQLFTALIGNELIGYASFERSERKQGGITQIDLKVGILEIVHKYRGLHLVTKLLEKLVKFLDKSFSSSPKIETVWIKNPLEDKIAYWKGLNKHTYLKLVIQ